MGMASGRHRERLDRAGHSSSAGPISVDRARTLVVGGARPALIGAGRGDSAGDAGALALAGLNDDEARAEEAQLEGLARAAPDKWRRP